MMFRIPPLADICVTVCFDNAVAVNPSGPAKSSDPRNPHQPIMRVIRGGSFLCHDSYCASDRPSARMATSPDTSLSHLGFRCVVAPKAASSDHATSSQTVKEIK